MYKESVDKVAIIQATRKKTADIISQVLQSLEGESELSIRDKILSKLFESSELYPQGWYDPPPGGTSILFGERPFDRLKYESIRDQNFWPSESFRLAEETVGLIYVSSNDKTTGLIGDHGLTIYRGEDEKIKEHIRTVFNTIYSVADAAKIGLTFAALYEKTMRIFNENNKHIKWMTTIHDPLKGVHLGHTVPGSMKNDVVLGHNFEEVKDSVRTKRIYINAQEQFEIPPTCAFTVEARLVDTRDPQMPNIFFHFIVTFSGGKKQILTNFDDIFRTVGMNYML